MICFITLTAVGGLPPSRFPELDNFRGRLRSVASSMMGPSMSNQQALSESSIVDSVECKFRENSKQRLHKKGILIFLLRSHYWYCVSPLV